MTEAELDQVEKKLKRKLPADYRDLLRHFPIRFEAGTTDGELWDNAAALIKRNRQLSTLREEDGETLKPLPPQYFLIGEDGTGWQHLIDTTREPSMVYTMEYEIIEQIRPALDQQNEHLTLQQWFDAYLDEFRQDGVDITSATSPQPQSTFGSELLILLGCFAAVFLYVLLVYVLEWLWQT